MVDYMQYLNSPRNRSSTKNHAPPEHKPLYDLWKINPTFRDVNRKWQARRLFIAGILGAFIILHCQLIGFSMFQVITVSAFLLMSFIVAFPDHFFTLKSWLSSKSFDPFHDKLFWHLDADDHSIFMTNKIDLFTVGIRIFRVEVLPENVSASIKHFVRALADVHEPINYQVIHQPILDASGPDRASFRTYLYFTVSDRLSGSLSPSKVGDLLQSLEMRASAVRSQFIADFHHFKISLLSSRDALKALRVVFLKIPPQAGEDKELDENIPILPSQGFAPVMLKFIMTLILTIFNGWLVAHAWTNPFFTMLASLGTCLAFIITFWREVRFSFSTKRLLLSPRVNIHDPFPDVSFYRFHKAPETLFFQVGGDLMGALKAMNVMEIPHPLYTNETTSKLYHSLIGQGISFSTNVIAVPQSYGYFIKKGIKKTKPKARGTILSRARSTHDQSVWMVQRAGMWNAELVLTTHAYRVVKEVSSEVLHDLERELQSMMSTFRLLFKQEYSQCELVPLKYGKLESALLILVFKSRFSRFGGNHLQYVFMQGIDLYPFMSIDNAFKKGIETKIAAEFNTPLHLENEITIGHTINTEFLEQEVASGFSFSQAKRVLILNGTRYSRENTLLTLAMELMIKGKSIIYFDFTGNASKLIPLLSDEKKVPEMLYHKLGKTITIDPTHSEIANDVNNVRFIDLMLDVYALSFKKDEHAIATFKNSLSKMTQNKDSAPSFRTLSLIVDSQQDWKKSPAVSSIMATLEDFNAQDSTYLYAQEDSIGVKMTVLDFLTTQKSVIVDVSSIKDLEKQSFFTWLIMAKYIHYQSERESFSPRYFVIPNIDMIFDHYFLERKMKYGKIAKLIDPLLRTGNGFICTASQAHFLHSNVFSIFQNYIAFKSTDKRDVAVIKNVLNLEELHGQGYYSKSRNEAYQVRYLMTMKENEALMKRTDIYQPFPVEFDFVPMDATPSLQWHDIITHMKSQGFDITDSERKILERAQKTVLEKDLDQFSFLIPELITFLEGLQTVHQIGNLYRNKIAEQLKHAIYPKLSAITQDKRHLKRMRDEILSILFTQGYLVESHPRQASGGQTIRTSYQVSPKFQTVLDDYYETKKSLSTNVELEVVSQETNDVPEYAFLDEGSDPTEMSAPVPRLPIDQIKAILKRLSVDILQWNLFQMHRNMSRQNFQLASAIGKDLAEMFLSNLQAEIEQLAGIQYSSREDFLTNLTSLNSFPFHEIDLSNLGEIDDTNLSPQEVSAKLFEKYKAFSLALDSYLQEE